MAKKKQQWFEREDKCIGRLDWAYGNMSLSLNPVSQAASYDLFRQTILAMRLAELSDLLADLDYYPPLDGDRDFE